MSAAAAGILGISNVFVALVEKIGLPGALLVVLFYILEYWSTQEQKHRMIEMYALGNGVSHAWQIIVLSGAAVLALFAQNAYFRRLMEIDKAEIARLGGEKTALQANAAAPTELDHTRGQGE